MIERAAHARAVATAKCRRVFRPSAVNPNQLDYARRLRDEGATIADIVDKTGITRTACIGICLHENRTRCTRIATSYQDASPAP